MGVQAGIPPASHDPSIAIKLMAAGTAACVAEAVTYPLDTAKVRLMVQGDKVSGVVGTKYRGLLHTMKTVSRTEGPKALYSGIVAGFHRQLVVGSVRIGMYDSAKSAFGQIFDGGRNDQYHASMATRICAGASTGIMAVSVGQPTDVVKIRMQAQGASGVMRYDSAITAYSKIVADEGVLCLWRGLLPNAMRTAIVNAAEIVSYDVIKSNLVRRQIMSDHTPCHFVSALGAALITTVVVSPVDVLKTRYMNSSVGQYKGLGHCFITLWNEKGLATFYKGCVPSFWRLSSWNIVMFTSFEQLKRVMCHAQDRVYAMNSKLKANESKWN